MIERLVAGIVGARKAILIIAGVITVVLGFFIKDIKINSDVTTYLPPEDPAAQRFTYLGSQYGGTMLALVAVETDDVFDTVTVQKVARLTEELQAISGMRYVTSLTNVLDFRGTGDGIDISRLVDVDSLPRTAADWQALRDYTLSRDLYRNQLVSEDGSTTLIACRLQPDADKIAITDSIANKAEAIFTGEKTYFAGYPFLMRDLSSAIVHDLWRLGPVVLLVIVIALAAGFRTARGVLLPLIAVLVSMVWTIGTMALLRMPMAIISDIIPVILMAVGSAYAIHVVSAWREPSGAGDAVGRSRERLRRVIVPVFLAAVTTMAGFISFIFGSYLTMIREFGILSAFGVLNALVISVTVIPALLTLLPERTGSGTIQDRPGRVSRALGRLIVRRRVLILVGTVILLVASAAGVFLIDRQVDIIDYFKADASARQSERLMEQRFGGSTPLQIQVQGDITDPAVLETMDSCARFLATLPDVHQPRSIADLLMEMNDLLGEGKRIPDQSTKVSNLMFLLEGEDIMGQLVNEDRTEAVIQSTLGSININMTRAVVRRVDEYCAAHSSSECTLSQSGMHLIYDRLDRAVMKNQLQSLVIALVLVFVVVALLLRSFSGGVIGILPVAAAIVVAFGVMGYSRIPLDIATMLVGGIAIGTGIDYAIHFTNRFRRALVEHSDVAAALAATLSTTGSAIVTNVVTLACGFLVLVFADLVPLGRFGLLVAVATSTAGLGSAIVLPAMMITAKINANDTKDKSRRRQ